MKFFNLIIRFVVVTFFLVTSSLYSQQGFFVVDAISLPSSCPDSGVVVLTSEFSHSMLPFFESSNKQSSSKEFISIFQLQFEIRDSLGVIRKRIVFKDTIFVATKEEALSNDLRTTKSHRLIMQRGFYSINALLQDQQGKLIKKQEVRSQMVQAQLNYVGTPTPNSDKVEVIDFWSSPNIASPSFTEKISETLYAQVPSGGKLPYSNQSVVVAAQCSYSNSKQEYEYSVVLLGNKEQQEKFWSWKVPTISGKIEARRFELVLDEVDNQTVLFKKVDISVPNFKCQVPIPTLIQIRGMIEFPLEIATLIPGTYKLTIKALNTTQVVERYFEVQWMNQAQSLKNSKFAASAMYHLIPEKEFRTVETLSEFQRWEFINAYWRKFDPTPLTSYNEAMVEYFRRADIARAKYQSINQKDGVQTDFGKILVLYGEPTKIESALDESKTEIVRWFYENSVQKQFEFKKTPNGLFTLFTFSELTFKK